MSLRGELSPIQESQHFGNSLTIASPHVRLSSDRLFLHTIASPAQAAFCSTLSLVLVYSPSDLHAFTATFQRVEPTSTPFFPHY